MACSSPNLIRVGSEGGAAFLGRRVQERQVHDLSNSNDYHTFDIPCGKCELCLIQRRYDRALRIMLEAESWPESTYFITLTFNQDHVGDGELNHKEWSQFIKNFRQKFCQAEYCDISKPRHFKNYGKIRSTTFKQIKQVMCGEYGDTFGRKHFHGIIFNHTFHDMYFTGNYSKKGNPIHSSKSLEEVWKKGFVEVEKINFDLALYVGGYVTDMNDDEVNLGRNKKQYGLFGRGIGEAWVREYWRDVLVANKVILSDKEFPIPRYFLKKIAEWHPLEYSLWKQKNLLRSLKQRERNIEKGDGPLRRAKAKGRIHDHKQAKRRIDNVRKKEQSVW